MKIKQTTVGQIVPYGPLSVNRQYHRNYEELQPKPQFDVVYKTALVGIEIECENITNQPYMEYYWSKKADGSLRNSGVEFVSIPLRASQVEYALDYLKNRVVLAGNDPDFSPRTSVHVHLNVRDMSLDQVKTLVLLYALFEKHFFNLVGSRREQSIFCVPLYRSGQLSTLRKLAPYSAKWHKYNAINLASIFGDDDVTRLGTIEFRHMYGTFDKQIIIPWINTILKLREASLKYSYTELLDKIKTLNTTSEYIAMYQNVFGEYANLPAMQKDDFESCVTACKLALWGHIGSRGFVLDSALGKLTYPKDKTDAFIIDF